MYKNNQIIDYQFEQILTEEGSYNFILFDYLGNKELFNFEIINKTKQRLKHFIENNITVTTILKNNQSFEFRLTDNQLYIADEGLYIITVLDTAKNKTYSFNIQIDTTAPTIELVGVVNLGQTKNNVTTKNPSESPIYIQVTRDYLDYEYSIGDTIEKSGTYQITLSDDAGNESIYSFTKIYVLNEASVGLIAGLLALLVIGMVLIFKSRNNFYKANVKVEEIEEVVEE
jgi:hypothetical protein